MPAQDLAKFANTLRTDVLKMVVAAGSGHVAGPLSSAEIMAVLYGKILRYDASNPWSEERDRFVLSCGHYCPVLYAALARSGHFPVEELATFMQTDSRLPGHPEYRCLPGVEATTGSLGQGVSQAVGKAMALKLKYGERPKVETPRVYCLLSDGEMQEGQVWEAINTAVRRQLDNLILLVDVNRVQIEHYVSEIVRGELVGRLESCGVDVLEVEGNNVLEVERTIKLAQERQGGVVAIVAHTTAGKNVSYMENKPEWHDKVPSEEQLKQAMEELNAE